MQTAILYAESEFTPWRENIDLLTVNTVKDNLPDYCKTEVLHMKTPSHDFGSKLAQYDVVVNLCYGYETMSQSKVAEWLDKFSVRHLSSSGVAQKRAEDKSWIEKCCVLHDIDVPKSIRQRNAIEDSLHIIKPRFGGCHRDIQLLNPIEMGECIESINFNEYICQQYLFGREFSVAVIPSDNGLEHISLTPVEIVPIPSREVFIAGNAYGKTERRFEYKIQQKYINEMKSIAVKLHELAGLKYLSRTDFKVVQDKIYVLDLNSMPNLHPSKSLLPAILEHQSISIKELFRRMFKMKSIHEGLSGLSVLGRR